MTHTRMQTQPANAITLISSRGHYWKHPAENITSGLRNKWGWFGRWLLVTCTTYFYPLITTTFGPCFQAIKTYFTECYLSKKINKMKTRNSFRGSPNPLSLPVWLMFWGGINTSLHACTEVNAWERWITLCNGDGFQKDGSGINNEFVLPSFFSVLVACFAAIK